MGLEKRTEWDGVKLLSQYNSQLNAWLIIAIHSLKKKRSAGGLRIKSYSNYNQALDDACLLSKAMTKKFELAEMQWGGGKAVIYLERELTLYERDNLLIDFGNLINELNGEYYVGPDIGSSSLDMDFLFQNGVKHVFSKTKQNGGAGDSSLPTARGVLAAIKATNQFMNGSACLNNVKINIQGLGGVGKILIGFLQKEGAIIAFSDIRDSVIREFKSKGLKYLDGDKVYSSSCDIFCPCGPGGIINQCTINLLNCKAVVGAANNQLNHKIMADELARRNILYAPDFLVNLGGAMGITLIEAEKISKEVSFKKVEKTIKKKLLGVYEKARENNCSTLDVLHLI